MNLLQSQYMYRWGWVMTSSMMSCVGVSGTRTDFDIILHVYASQVVQQTAQQQQLPEEQ
jgi:hypothetical protein